MSRRVLLVGIGAGDPDHLTLAAVRALNSADVVFLVDKGPVAEELRAHRRALLDQVVKRDPPQRAVERALTAVRGRDRGGYPASVQAWRAERADAYRELIEGLEPGEAGAFLVWGDPTLYDGTLATLAELRRHVEFEVEVIPGISSVSALAARHGVALNRAGEAVQFTTGRRLAEHGMPDDVDSVVVLLDSHEAWRALEDDLQIWWGAFLGMEHEVIVAGRLGDVRREIEQARDRAQRRLGWMFDTYLIRRSP